MPPFKSMSEDLPKEDPEIVLPPQCRAHARAHVSVTKIVLSSHPPQHGAGCSRLWLNRASATGCSLHLRGWSWETLGCSWNGWFGLIHCLGYSITPSTCIDRRTKFEPVSNLTAVRHNLPRSAHTQQGERDEDDLSGGSHFFGALAELSRLHDSVRSIHPEVCSPSVTSHRL